MNDETIIDADNFVVQLLKTEGYYRVYADFDSTSVSDEHSGMLERFRNAMNPHSEISSILGNPLVKQLGMSFASTQDAGHIRGIFELPTAETIHAQLGELGIVSPFRFVEHDGGHIEPDQYVTYLNLGQYPLANKLCWQLIHDRLEHVLGVLSLAPGLAEFIKNQAEHAESRKGIRVLTDFVDELTYKNTAFARSTVTPISVFEHIENNLLSKHPNAMDTLQGELDPAEIRALSSDSLLSARQLSGMLS